MTYYPIPNSTGFIDFIQWSNQVTSYLLGPLLVLAWVAIVFLALKNYPTEKAYAAATFSGMILCLGFYAIGICEIQHLLITGVAMLISIFMLRSPQY